MNARQRSRERERGRAWVRSLSSGELADLGDEFVLGTFDWREWGFKRRPTHVFLRAADEERIYLEAPA